MPPSRDTTIAPAEGAPVTRTDDTQRRGARDSKARTGTGRLETPTLSNSRLRSVRAVFGLTPDYREKSGSDNPMHTAPANLSCAGERL